MDGEKRKKYQNLAEVVNRFKERLEEFRTKKPDIESAKRAYEEKRKVLAERAMNNFEKKLALMVINK